MQLLRTWIWWQLSLEHEFPRNYQKPRWENIVIVSMQHVCLYLMLVGVLLSIFIASDIPGFSENLCGLVVLRMYVYFFIKCLGIVVLLACIILQEQYFGWTTSFAIWKEANSMRICLAVTIWISFFTSWPNPCVLASFHGFLDTSQFESQVSGAIQVS